ncbi:SAF domain-containing protein [Nocardioides sp. AE5]|uniref:SAF domain-containing protein n=1 Tax=Nocardioides sp. AE5 TaxID=2962573 RepID=UPI00288123D5|nr:SAF domain-containing protein [Nocardioides sp. AE5]MDT0203111.1 SAF domain-containing protein [Nocardioides sp. AE5]
MEFLGFDDVRRTLRRAVLRRRRLLAALLVGIAVFATLSVLAPPPAATVSVVVAAADLPSGTVLAEDDVVVAHLPAEAVPDGALGPSYVVGRTIASPVRRGETLTDVRLVGEPLLEGYPGLVAIPVRLPDAAAASLLRVGDRIDLLATNPGNGETRQVGSGLPVIALPAEAGSAQRGVASGRLVVLGTTPQMSTKVTSASVRMYLTAVISR